MTSRRRWSQRIALGALWVGALALGSSGASALEIQYADPVSGGPVLLRGDYSLSCYQYVCSDQGVTGDDGRPPYSEYTQDIAFATDPDGYFPHFGTYSLRPDSIEAMAQANGSSIETGNEAGDRSRSWRTRRLDIQLSVDEDTTFRFLATTVVEGRGEASVRLFGPQNPRRDAVSFGLVGSDTADIEITLLSGVLYTLSASADTRRVQTNDTAHASFSLSLVPVPEPGTGLCLGIGLVGLARWRSAQRSNSIS